MQAIDVRAPWAFETAAIETGSAPTLHFGGGLLFATSAQAGTVTIIDPHAWEVLRVVSLGEGSEPDDVSAVSRRRAYVSRRGATHLLRLDPCTGETAEGIDLRPLADADGIPDLGSTVRDGRRLFVQVRRLNGDAPGGFEHPAQIGVIDLATEELVDVDAQTAGVQGIALEGTLPKTRMQVVRSPRRLVVGASGGFFDEGGIELIDLATLDSLGLVVREADAQVGADLGSFVMTKRDRGYLTYSTDLLLSSHLHQFAVDGTVVPEQLHVSVDYFAPALAHDPPSQNLFVPEAGFGAEGVHVFDARTGRQLTEELIRTSGPPSDLVIVEGGSRRAGGCRAPVEEPPTLVPPTGSRSKQLAEAETESSGPPS
ncbi:MAG: hypothetical protein FJ144_04430 [Deltaproteobacteria bacterium]|nr:hypothetical protein [Deltaproteobacteria bacterium]